MKRPDLIILVVVWQFINAFLALISVIAIGALVYPAVVGKWGGRCGCR